MYAFWSYILTLFLCKIKPLSGGLWKKWRLPSSSFFRALRCGVLCFFLSMHFSWRKLWNKIAFFWLFSIKPKHVSWKWLYHLRFSSYGDFKTSYSFYRQRTRKNKDDGSLHFFHRPPERGLILHRICVMVPRPASGDGTSALWEGTPTLCRGCREAK